MIGNFDPNITRDEAYIRALNNFNGWRNKRRKESEDSPQKEITIKEISNESDSGGDDEHEAISSGGDDEIVQIENHIPQENYKKYNSYSSTTCDTPTSDDQPNIKFSPSKVTKRKRNTRPKRTSPSYQTVVNKHGDVVEYALPYNEQNGPKEPTTDEVTTDRATPGSFIADPMSIFLQNHQKENLVITDLDKSMDSRYMPNRDIFKELDSLEKWSETINKKTCNDTFNPDKVCFLHYLKFY